MSDKNVSKTRKFQSIELNSDSSTQLNCFFMSGVARLPSFKILL